MCWQLRCSSSKVAEDTSEVRISGHSTHRRDVRMAGYPLGGLTDPGQRGGVTGLRSIVLAADPACHDQGVHRMRREGASVYSASALASRCS